MNSRLPKRCAVPHPHGFSLIEVILATAILLGSVVVLSQLAGLGRTHAQNTEKMAQLQRLCENTLNEIVLGIRPASPVEAAPLLAVTTDEEMLEDAQGEILTPGRNPDQLAGTDESPRWLHSIRISPAPGTPGLASLTLEVMEARRSGRRRMRFALTRWIPAASPRDAFSDLDSEADALFERFEQ